MRFCFVCCVLDLWLLGFLLDAFWLGLLDTVTDTVPGRGCHGSLVRRFEVPGSVWVVAEAPGRGESPGGDRKPTKFGILCSLTLDAQGEAILERRCGGGCPRACLVTGTFRRIYVFV